MCRVWRVRLRLRLRFRVRVCIRVRAAAAVLSSGVCSGGISLLVCKDGVLHGGAEAIQGWLDGALQEVQVASPEVPSGDEIRPGPQQ